MESLLGLVPFEVVFAWGQEILQSEVAKMTIAFMLAARLHRQWVKKDMGEQFTLLRGAIDHVADVMEKRIDGLDQRVERLEERK